MVGEGEWQTVMVTEYGVSKLHTVSIAIEASMTWDDTAKAQVVGGLKKSPSTQVCDP